MVDTLKLAPAKGVLELEVKGRLGIVCQFLRRMLVDPQHVSGDAKLIVITLALVEPIVVPIHRAGQAFRLVTKRGLGFNARSFHFFHQRVRAHEELKLHLLKLTGPEEEVARVDLVAECLANLPDAKRYFVPTGNPHLVEIHKYRLAGFRA